jgi:hypothetical protein
MIMTYNRVSYTKEPIRNNGKLTSTNGNRQSGTSKVPEPKQAKREEKPAVAKETVTETRVVQDGGIENLARGSILQEDDDHDL